MFWLYLPPHNSSKSDSSTLVSLSIQLQVFLFFFLPVYLLILLYKPTEHIHIAQLLLRVGPAWSVFSLPGIIPLKKIGSPPNRYQLLIAPHFVVRFFPLSVVPPCWNFLWRERVHFLGMYHNCHEFLMQLTVLLSPRKQFLWCPPSPLALTTFLSPLLFWSLSLSGRSLIFMFYLRLSTPQFLILCS